MTDRGAIESIAEELCGDPKYHGSEHIADAQRILDRLAADGWALVKVEEQEARDLAFHSGCRLCGIRDLTQPYVPTREFKRIHTNCLRRVLADLGDDFIKRLRAEPVPEGSEDA